MAKLGSDETITCKVEATEFKASAGNALLGAEIFRVSVETLAQVEAMKAANIEARVRRENPKYRYEDFHGVLARHRNELDMIRDAYDEAQSERSA